MTADELITIVVGFIAGFMVAVWWIALTKDKPVSEPAPWCMACGGNRLCDKHAEKATDRP